MFVNVFIVCNCIAYNYDVDNFAAYFKMNMSDIHQNIKIENENIDERILETKFSLQGIENKIVYEEHRHDTDALIHGDGHISCTKDQDICMVERSTDFQRDRIVLKDTPNHVSVIACHSEALQPNESLYDDCHWIIDNTEKNDIEIKGNVSESFKQCKRIFFLFLIFYEFSVTNYYLVVCLLVKYI